MYCIQWTYIVPPNMTKEIIDKQFAAVADRYLGVQGLIRKYFGYSDDGKTVIGIYLWHSKQAADAFYTPEWIAGVTERWGATPTKTEWTVSVVAESEEGKVMVDS
jgi:hypothetical protein